MKKKLFKYIKFFVSMALILSLIAPSYASLSASDGSAFVTKAEFDSALADFNSRLTTFEAGINSKIDSQVTSYLDRNGIWSGSKQALAILNENSFSPVKNFSLSLNSVSAYTWDVEVDPEGIMQTSNTPGVDDGWLKFIYDRLNGNKPYYWGTSTPQGGTLDNDPGAAFIKMLGRPLNVVPSISKSGLLFSNINVSAGEPRYGAMIFVGHGEYSRTYSIKGTDERPLLGANADRFMPYLSSAAYWCVTPASVEYLSENESDANYWQNYIVGSFTPMNWVFVPDSAEWFKKTMYGVTHDEYLAWSSTYSPNQYISNFFVSKTDRVWLVPAVIFTLSAGWYYYWFWSSTHWSFVANGNVNKKNYLTMKMIANVY